MCRFLLQSPCHESHSSLGARDSQELGALRPAQAPRRHLEVAVGASCLRGWAEAAGSADLCAWFPPSGTLRCAVNSTKEGLTWRTSRVLEQDSFRPG